MEACAWCCRRPNDSQSGDFCPQSSRVLQAVQRTLLCKTVLRGRFQPATTTRRRAAFARAAGPLPRAATPPPRRRAARRAPAALHSITSSVLASNVGGTSRPSALAVLRLINQFVFGRRLYRNVTGLLTLEDAIDIGRRSPILVAQIRPVGDQAAGGDEVAEGIYRRQSMPRCERDDQLAMNGRQCARHQSRPPFGPRANAATARSISPTSRRPTGLTSTPSDAAAPWIAPTGRPRRYSPDEGPPRV